MSELDGDDQIREEWALAMNCRRRNHPNRRKTPDTKSFAKQNTASECGYARNKFCLPDDERGPIYDQLLPLDGEIRRCADGLLRTHVVFHSVDPPNHLRNSQDYRPDQIATATILKTYDAEQPENAPGKVGEDGACASKKVTMETKAFLRL